MRKLVIFTEEKSIEPIFNALCQEFLAKTIDAEIIPFSGYALLQSQFPKVLKTEFELYPETHFIITRDADSLNCIKMKQDLKNKVPENSKASSKVRIICQHLENWYLGDLHSLQKASNASAEEMDIIIKRIGQTAVDDIDGPRDSLLKPILREKFGSTVDFATKIAPYLIKNHLNNTSHSFQLMVQTLKAYNA